MERVLSHAQEFFDDAAKRRALVIGSGADASKVSKVAWILGKSQHAYKQEMMVEADRSHVTKQQVHHQVMMKVNHTAWEVEVVGP